MQKSVVSQNMANPSMFPLPWIGQKFQHLVKLQICFEVSLVYLTILEAAPTVTIYDGALESVYVLWRHGNHRCIIIIIIIIIINIICRIQFNICLSSFTLLNMHFISFHLGLLICHITLATHYTMGKPTRGRSRSAVTAGHHWSASIVAFVFVWYVSVGPLPTGWPTRTSEDMFQLHECVTSIEQSIH